MYALALDTAQFASVLQLGLAATKLVLGLFAAALSGVLALKIALLALVVACLGVILDLLGLGDVPQSRRLETREHFLVKVNHVRREDEHPLHSLLAR